MSQGAEIETAKPRMLPKGMNSPWERKTIERALQHQSHNTDIQHAAPQTHPSSISPSRRCTQHSTQTHSTATNTQPIPLFLDDAVKEVSAAQQLHHDVDHTARLEGVHHANDVRLRGVKKDPV
jgi:hypothetical protein